MSGILQKFRKDRAGVTAVEYGILAALIVVVLIVAARTLGTQIGDTFQSISDTMKSAQTSADGN